MTKSINRIVALGLIWVLGTAALFNSISTPRTFFQSTLVNSNFEGLFRGFEAAAMLGLVVLGLIAALFYKNNRKGSMIYVGINLVYLASIVSIFNGTVPKNNYTIWLMVGVYSAIFTLKFIDLDWVNLQIKRVILLYVYGSLIMIFIKPHWALEFGYMQGIIPGFRIRLHGFGVHANNLSALLVIYLMLAQITKSKYEKIHFVFIIICLVLTQSKTAWVIFGLYFLLVSYRKYRQVSRNKKLLMSGIFFIALGVISAASVVAVQHIFSKNSDLSTLTGRTQIWEFTISAWKTNPLFGYGQDLWGTAMEDEYMYLYNWRPPHAHNQFLQTLGESGLLGAFALSFYFIVLIYFAFKLSKKTNGVSLYLVIYFLVRGISEPIIINTISSANLFTHFIMFTFLVFAAKSVPVDMPVKQKSASAMNRLIIRNEVV